MKHRYNKLGPFLKAARLSANMTQKDLATRLGYSNPQFISNWERGDSSPPPKIIRKLVSALDLNEREILAVIMEEQKDFWLKFFSKKIANS